MSAVRGAARRLDAIGGRRQALLLIGVIWVLIGYGRLVEPPPLDPMALLPHEMLPLWARASLWALPGAVAMTASTLGRPQQDVAAFAFLIVAPSVLVCSYAWAWIVYLLPAGDLGLARGWSIAIQYQALVVLLFVLARHLPVLGRRA